MNLLKQKEEFLKRQTKAIDNAPKPSTSSHTTYVPVDSRQKTKRKKTNEASKAQLDKDSAKTSAENAANFGILASIVDFMKKRFLTGVSRQFKSVEYLILI